MVCATSKALDQPVHMLESLEYFMIVKLLTELHLEFLSLKEAVLARLYLHFSKCQIVGIHMSRLKF